MRWNLWRHIHLKLQNLFMLQATETETENFAKFHIYILNCAKILFGALIFLMIEGMLKRLQVTKLLESWALQHLGWRGTQYMPNRIYDYYLNNDYKIRDLFKVKLYTIRSENKKEREREKKKREREKREREKRKKEKKKRER